MRADREGLYEGGGMAAGLECRASSQEIQYEQKHKRSSFYAVITYAFLITPGEGIEVPDLGARAESPWLGTRLTIHCPSHWARSLALRAIRSHSGYLGRGTRRS